jgi:ankyrin repeat protein
MFSLPWGNKQAAGAPAAPIDPAEQERLDAQKALALEQAETELFNGASSGNMPQLEAALARGARGVKGFTGQNGQTSTQNALMAAASLGQIACVERLIPLCDVNALAIVDGSDALVWAAWGGSAGCVERLLAAGADPLRRDGAGRQPVEYARMQNSTGAAPRGEPSDHARCAALLEAATAAVFAAQSDPRALVDGRTKLMRAAELGDANALRSLLAVSDSRQKGDRGLTALMFAASGARSECVRLLVDGGDPQAVDEAGMDALMHAVSGGGESAERVECVRRLLPASDPRQKDADGRTALLRAVIERKRSLVEALAPASDPTAVDQQEKTAIDWAVAFGEWGSLGALCRQVPDESARQAIEKALNALDPELARRAAGLWGGR